MLGCIVINARCDLWFSFFAQFPFMPLLELSFSNGLRKDRRNWDLGVAMTNIKLGVLEVYVGMNLEIINSFFIVCFFGNSAEAIYLYF